MSFARTCPERGIRSVFYNNDCNIPFDQQQGRIPSRNVALKMDLVEI